VSRQVAQQQQDSTRMKHISMVMTSSQAARLAGTSVTSKEDANILQGWLRRKVKEEKKKKIVFPHHSFSFFFFRFTLCGSMNG
jgi:hypothetical protein